MGINQIKSQIEIIFLKKFTAEIINGIIRENQAKKNVEVEKIKQKLIRGEEKEEVFGHFNNAEVFFETPISGYKVSKKLERNDENRGNINFSLNKTDLLDELKDKRIKSYKLHKGVIPKIPLRKGNIFQKRKNRKVFVLRPQRVEGLSSNFDLNQKSFKRTKNLEEINPVINPRPPYLVSEKIEILLKDPSIKLIECMGPGKNLLVKRYGQINITKIKLDQDEINRLINNFAEHSRIPILNGILKAAVGDLIISGLLSNLNNSRFIIEKIIAKN